MSVCEDTVLRFGERDYLILLLLHFKNRPLCPTPKRRVKTEQFCNLGAGGGDISVNFVPVSLLNNSTVLYVCSLHFLKSHLPSYLGPQYHREQLCGLGARRSPPTGYVSGWLRLQDPEPAEETAESCYSALLHKGGGYHHLRGGPFCGSHRLWLHLDRTLAGGWRCWPRSFCFPYRYNQTPVTGFTETMT